MIEKINSTFTKFVAISLTSVSALGIPTTNLDLSQQYQTLEVAPIYSSPNEGGYDTETLKLLLPEDNSNHTNSYERMAGFFAGELRDLTKEEKEEYNEILNSIYKPTEINIFDLC